MSLKKSKPQPMSPSPKNPIPKRSSPVSRKIIFWGLIISLALIVVACLLDYQQGKLADHSSRLPYEVQVATKYLVNLASELPEKVQFLYEGARGEMVLLSGKIYVGDKTVAQLLFGEEVGVVDPTPEDVKIDFQVDDLLEGVREQVLESIEEGNTLDYLKAAEEDAVKMRKQEELRIYEENKKKMKEEALKVMEDEKIAAMNALLEEKAKLKAKIEAETATRKAKAEQEVEVGEEATSPASDKLKAEIVASTDAMKAQIAAKAAAAYEEVLIKQREEMSRLAGKLNKKIEKNKEAEEAPEQGKSKESYETGKQDEELVKVVSEDFKKTMNLEKIVNEEDEAF